MRDYEVSEEEVLDFLEGEEALLADGFEDALIGYVEIFSNAVALYDRDKCIEILMEGSSMSEEEAIEYFEFNVVGAYVGPKTPAFATLMSR
jgi:hypothetical protein